MRISGFVVEGFQETGLAKNFLILASNISSRL